MNNYSSRMTAMVFIPKSVVGRDNFGETNRKASDTRPLSITNADSRIIASSMRYCIEPIFASWVSA